MYSIFTLLKIFLINLNTHLLQTTWISPKVSDVNWIWWSQLYELPTPTSRTNFETKSKQVPNWQFDIPTKEFQTSSKYTFSFNFHIQNFRLVSDWVKLFILTPNSRNGFSWKGYSLICNSLLVKPPLWPLLLSYTKHKI